jgi:hypothetical protein
MFDARKKASAAAGRGYTGSATYTPETAVGGI